MALQNSGQISIADMMTELGISGQTSLNDADIRGLIDKASGAQMSMSEWYGAANAFAFNAPSGNTSNATLSTLATAAGWDGSTPVVMTIPSGSVLHAASNTSNFGLIVDVANSTIVNNGAITGYGASREGDGGHAVKINVTGITLQNNSGAFLAGGGGGGHGDGAGYPSYNPFGGAGAGQRTPGETAPAASNGPGFGYINANCYGYSYGNVNAGAGGDQGTGGTGTWVYHQQSCHTGGHGFNYFSSRISAGGSVLSATQNNDGSDSMGGGGGGGWGRSGRGSNGGAGGKAVEDTGNTYTLTNNGTIYGATT